MTERGNVMLSLPQSVSFTKKGKTDSHVGLTDLLGMTGINTRRLCPNCHRTKPSSGRKVDFCRRQKDGRSRRKTSCISAVFAFSQSLTRCRQGGIWNYALPQSKPAVLPAPSRREPWQYVLFVKVKPDFRDRGRQARNDGTFLSRLFVLKIPLRLLFQFRRIVPW